MTIPVDDNTITMFLNDIENVCRKYQLSISHEDTHGAFIIEIFNKDSIDWLRAAFRSAKYQDR